MDEVYTVKRFPLVSELARLIAMTEEHEGEVLEIEYGQAVPKWKENVNFKALFDDDEVVEIKIRVRPKEESN